MKKTVFRCGCFLLLFAMLFLSSCKGSGKPPVDTGVSAEPILPEQLKGYSLVRPQMTSDSVISGASDLYEAMLTLLGGTPDFGTDFLEAGKEADSSKKEILVGHTNRPETAQVLETLKAGEFAVAAVGNKLVITGFTEAFTPLAVQWFLANYLTGTAAEIPGDLRHIGTAEAITLVEAGKPLYRLIRAQYATDGAMDGMYRIAEALENLGSGTPDVKTDSAAHDSEAPEILVGQTNYDEFNNLKESCAPDTYGIYYVGQKIILFGWTDEDVTLAVDAFVGNLKYASYTDKDGKVSVSYPRENIVASNNAGYYGDLPVSAAGRYYDGVFNCGDKTVQLFWKGVDETVFDAYCRELEAQGFAVWQTNRGTSVSAATYRKDNTQVHAYWLKHLSEMRVSAQENANFPILASEYTKICDVSVTQLGLNYPGGDLADSTVVDDLAGNVGGMGYVILLEDGTFAVIDGGYPNEKDALTLWNTLNSLKPAGVKDIVIRAWFLTHGHHDHYGVLRQFMSDYSDRVKVEQLITNDPSDFLYSKSDQRERGFNPNSIKGKFGGCVYQKAHTGQQFFLPGVTFTVLFTQEDSSTSSPYKTFNSLSMVFDAVTNDTRFIWFGDAQREAALRIKSMYYEDMKCDVMQVAHHGVNGGSLELFELCNPKIAFFPVAESLYRSIANLEQNRYIVGSCERVLFAYDGTQTISFAETPDFGKLDGEQGDGHYSKFY